jgi:hypothetical protein
MVLAVLINFRDKAAAALQGLALLQHPVGDPSRAGDRVLPHATPACYLDALDTTHPDRGLYVAIGSRLHSIKVSAPSYATLPE